MTEKKEYEDPSILTASNEGMTPKQQEAEYERCTLDFCYWAKTYVKITHPKKGLVHFKLYPYQERVINDYGTHKHNIIKKFRQGGLTTLTVIWCLWRCMFKLDQKIMVLSKSDREATGAGKIVTNVIKYLPAWMCPAMEKDNEHEKVFSDTNGSIEFWTCEAARSKSLTYLIIDEAAFIKGMDDHWKSMYPTLATGGSCIVISTVNGMGNWYEEWYHTAVENRNEFHVIDLEYTENPEYNNDAWIKEMKANLGDRGWRQEVLGDFLSSGDTFIPGTVIKRIERHSRINPPIKRLFPEWESESDSKEDWHMLNPKYEKGALWLWEEPIDGEEYVLSADTSEGVADDASAFHIIRNKTMTQVAEFASDIVPPHLFAQVIHHAAMYYNNALVIVESMGVGLAVLNKLQYMLYYDNLYFEQKGIKERAGAKTDKVTRPIALTALQTALIHEQVVINSPRFVRELKTFEYSKTKKRPEARKGKHDDLIMALAIMLGVKDTWLQDIPIGAEELVKTQEITKQEMFVRIKAEIEGGLIEDLLKQLENDDEKNGMDAQDAKFVGKSIRAARRPYDALLREFAW